MTSGPTKNIIFFGTEEFSAMALERLIAEGYSIAAVITKPDLKKGRGHKLAEPKVKTIARTHNIPVWQPDKLSEVIDAIRELQPVAGVLVSYGKIIPQRILDLFDPGIINVHPSLLPKYRGPSPIEASILSGDEEIGVTIMKLSAKMDAGPIYAQRRINKEYGERDRLFYLGIGLLCEVLPEILNGQCTPQPQNESQATYCHYITKQDGVIDWNKPAERLEQEITLYKDWPRSRTTLHGIDVIITDAIAQHWCYNIGPDELQSGQVSIDSGAYKRPHHDPLEVSGEADYQLLVIGAGENTWLEILKLQPAGKKEMTAREFINGYGHHFPKESWRNA